MLDLPRLLTGCRSAYEKDTIDMIPRDLAKHPAETSLALGMGVKAVVKAG